MEEQLRTRLAELRAEFETGQQKLGELESQATALRQLLLRISGAVQVLEEELAKAHADQGAPPDHSQRGAPPRRLPGAGIARA